jgi:hypothetical protein
MHTRVRILRREVCSAWPIDTNVHLSLYGGMADRYETLARYKTSQERG